MGSRSALTLLIAVALVAGLGDRLDVLGRLGIGAPASGANGSGSAVRVQRVVDGDTIKVMTAQGLDTVRYIGMDTPETKKPGTPVQCYGKRASHENERLVAGQRVRLVVGAEPRDRYGRLLAYVYRERDGTFVNERLLAGGFARTLTIAPNDRYASRFAAVQARAQSAHTGMWGAC
jgi:micrococcal nuclease